MKVRGESFTDSFDLSNVGYTSIEWVELTLWFSDAAQVGLNVTQNWQSRIQGSDNSFAADDWYITLDSAFRPASMTMRMITDEGGNFDQTVATGVFEFWFSDLASDVVGLNNFDLDAAQLQVSGTTAVPLPAGLALLLGALGGLVIVRRRAKT